MSLCKCKYTPIIFLWTFVHGFRKDFSEKNNSSYLKYCINHLILITLFFLIPPVHDNVLAVSIETRSANSSTSFYSLFFIFICYPETNSLGSPKYMLLKMTASHLKETAIECFQGNKCSAFAPINFFNCALTAWAYFFINSSMEK